ncbi:hypothetical protein KFK09_015350 [Dendrobium nobile]|uniref:Serine/threonine-protein phosphatase 7 long form-like n=1 Tax=Dendrobium nobile TaxID=94219 RepID=A0A8T3B5N1_DENNO|nr:hypothetical protein KFK09_015350 [Dendrobium nobile]
MSSGSSDPDPDDYENDSQYHLDEVNVDMNPEIHSMVQRYCFTNVGTTEGITVNNDFVKAYSSTREWDEDVANDRAYVGSQVEEEFSIPIELMEGMCFTKKEDLQFALQGWSIINNVEYVIVASNRQKFTVVCAQSGRSDRPCLWRLHAGVSKRLGGIWKISSMKNQHTCATPILTTGHRQCNSQFISYFILPSIRRHMDLKPREIIGQIEAKFNIKVSYMKAWDARRKAVKIVFGSWEESYRTINLFMDAVVFSMPETVYKIQTSENHRFERLFFSFGPSIKGWSYCRPVLCLDGTFLLGKYRGTLLTAVGIDANNGLYPLAFAIVESECVDSWVWFLSQLHILLPIVSTRPDLCIISDRHAGLVRGCREIFPHAAHRHCLRHLRENFKKAVRRMGVGDVEFLCQKMYMAGNTNDPMIFDRCMKDMINVKADIHQWLVERDVTSWALTYDGGFRYGVMTTNASESFNGVLKRARGLPIQALITAIYYNVVSLHLRRNEMLEGSEFDASSIFAPRVQATLRKIEQEARFMAAAQDRGRGRRGRPSSVEASTQPSVHTIQPSISSLAGSHRAAHPEQGTILEAASHLLMVHEWPINCPRFMEALVFVGLDSVSQMRYRRMDHHLLTALVERWSPQTNTFHLPVGEMSIMLQDVSMILGIQIDGPSFVGHPVVGSGRRWMSWPDCCDDLLGQHPDPDVLYHDPFNPRITAKFRMGQAHAQTCVPLRWLRWIFWRDSYIDLSEMDFWRHVRAYILFILGCHLLPDTSGSEIHLQYLPLMEDIAIFRTYSLGGAVLAHLYRELSEATRPKRANIAGCIHLLQIWSWEHLHVGRPQLHVPFPIQLDGLSVGIRWNEERLREVPVGNVMTYRDELDGLLESQVIWEPYTAEIRAQVPEICTSGQDIWLSRVPLISWKRVEWHLPDRVLRQFGYCPSADIMPMDPSFVRVDGRGKSDTDWALYHQASIALWESRRAYIVTGEIPGLDYDYKVKQYLAWFHSWATLYMLKPSVDPPSTYYPRSPAERHMLSWQRDFFVSMERRLQPHFGGTEGTPLQMDVNIVGDMCQRLRQQIYIDDAHYFDEADAQVFSPAIPTTDPYDAGPSSYPDLGPSRSHFAAEFDVASTPQFVPSSLGEPPVTQQDVSDQDQRHLRTRPLRAPQHFTPGTDAIPHRHKRRH